MKRLIFTLCAAAAMAAAALTPAAAATRGVDPSEFNVASTFYYINGTAHNVPLTIGGTAQDYYTYAQGGGWYTVSASNLCMEAIPATLKVELESCNGSQLENWAFTADGSYTLLQVEGLGGYYILVHGNGNDITVEYEHATAFYKIAS